MAGTKPGGKQAAATNRAKYGNDFYHRIGALGGSKGHTGGFAANRDLARLAGTIGGRMSRRNRRLSEYERAKIRAKYDHEIALAYGELSEIQATAKRKRDLVAM